MQVHRAYQNPHRDEWIMDGKIRPICLSHRVFGKSKLFDSAREIFYEQTPTDVEGLSDGAHRLRMRNSCTYRYVPIFEHRLKLQLQACSNENSFWRVREILFDSRLNRPNFLAKYFSLKTLARAWVFYLPYNNPLLRIHRTKFWYYVRLSFKYLCTYMYTHTTYIRYILIFYIL